MNKILKNITVVLATICIGYGIGCSIASAADSPAENFKKSLRESFSTSKQTDPSVKKSGPAPIKQIAIKPGTKLCQVEQNPELKKGITYYLIEEMKENTRFTVGYYALTEGNPLKGFTLLATIRRSEIENDGFEMIIERAFSVQGEQVKEVPLILLVQSRILFPGVHQALKLCPDLNKLMNEVEAKRKATQDAEQEEQAIRAARNHQYRTSRDEVDEISDELRKQSEMFCERELAYINPTKPVLRPKNLEKCEALKKQVEEIANNLRAKYPFVTFEIRNYDDGNVGLNAMNQNP